MTFRPLCWEPDNVWHREAAVKVIRAFGWDWSAWDVKINRFRNVA